MASLVADAPEDHRLRMGYARLLLQLDRHEAAREQFRIVRERVPDDPDPLYALALLAIEAEQPDEAEPYFQRLLALGERENEAAYYLGSIAQTRERFPEAMTWYTRVAEGELRDEAALRIAQLHMQQGAIAPARETLRALRARNFDIVVKVYLFEVELLQRDGRVA